MNWTTQSMMQREFDLYYNDFLWEFEDELPEMSDTTYEELFPFSEVRGGVRMFPYINNADGKIYIAFV